MLTRSECMASLRNAFQRVRPSSTNEPTVYVANIRAPVVLPDGCRSPPTFKGWWVSRSRRRRYGILCCSSSLATYSAVILFPDPGRPSTKIILVPSIVAYTAQPRRIVSHGSYFDKDLWPPGRASYPPGTAQGFSAARGSEAR